MPTLSPSAQQACFYRAQGQQITKRSEFPPSPLNYLVLQGVFLLRLAVAHHSQSRPRRRPPLDTPERAGSGRQSPLRSPESPWRTRRLPASAAAAAAATPRPARATLGSLVRPRRRTVLPTSAHPLPGPSSGPASVCSPPGLLRVTKSQLKCFTWGRTSRRLPRGSSTKPFKRL